MTAPTTILLTDRQREHLGRAYHGIQVTSLEAKRAQEQWTCLVEMLFDALGVSNASTVDLEAGCVRVPAPEPLASAE